MKTWARIRRITARLLGSVGLLLLIVMFTPLVNWWATILAGPWTDPKGDVLIVLGGGTIHDAMVAESSYWRSVFAVLAWRDDKFSRIVVSGKTVSEPMRRFMVYEGVPAGIVETEGKSTSTRENALYTAQLLRETKGRLVLLTSDYHMFRARRVFTKVGLEVAPRPFADARKRGQFVQHRWSAFVDLTQESVKIVYYKVRGWI